MNLVEVSKYIKINLFGLVISLLGSLPFGTLNLTAFYISVTQNLNAAIVFVVAAVLVELVIVRLTLATGHRINFRSRLFYYAMPVAILMLLYLGISSFISSNESRGLETSINIFPMIKSTFLLGILLSIINPFHAPYWMVWNAVLFKRQVLFKTSGMYSSYIIGIGMGTFTSLMIFVIIGSYAYQTFRQFHFIIAYVMGSLYLGFSMYLLFQFYKNHLNLKTAKNV